MTASVGLRRRRHVIMHSFKDTIVEGNKNAILGVIAGGHILGRHFRLFLELQ